METAEFANRWNDVWFVHHVDRPMGLGHITSQVDDDGNVCVVCRLDIHPGEDAQVTLESELVITDVNSFSWSTYRTTESATPSAAEMTARRGMKYDGDAVITPVGPNKLSVRDKDRAAVTIDASGDGPIIPDWLAQLYLCTRPFDKSDRWPVRFLSFNRTMEGRQWAVWSNELRYAGRKGPQTGLSHTFESCPPEAGRVFSVWFDADGQFIGWGDEVEVFLAADDEQTARAFIEMRAVAT